jgi:hypothetical protein
MIVGGWNLVKDFFESTVGFEKADDPGRITDTV